MSTSGQSWQVIFIERARPPDTHVAAVSQPTVKAWLGALEAADLAHLVPPYFESFGKRLVRSPKLYFLSSSRAPSIAPPAWRRSSGRSSPARAGQEYEDPLLVLRGDEYQTLSFAHLHQQLCDALRGDRPRLDLIFLSPEGDLRLFFADGSTQEVPRDDEP